MELCHQQLQCCLALGYSCGCNHVLCYYSHRLPRMWLCHLCPQWITISCPGNKAHGTSFLYHKLGEFFKWMLKVPGFDIANATLLRISTPGKGAWLRRVGHSAANRRRVPTGYWERSGIWGGSQAAQRQLEVWIVKPPDVVLQEKNTYTYELLRGKIQVFVVREHPRALSQQLVPFN